MAWRLPSVGFQRCLATAARQANSSSHAEVQQTLAAYPVFNLNDNAGRALGPRRGDEAVLTLSGGVDSSVAAFLALKEGGLIPHRTIFMRNWSSLDESGRFQPGSGGAAGCEWQRDWERVMAMARWLGVEAELMDLSAPYWNSVFSPALDDWARGWTPNPDVLCNREIKFGELLRRVDQREAFGRRQTRRWLVTGHYAGLQYYLPNVRSTTLHGRLYRAQDRSKDQSYFLSAVGSEQLGRTHLPLSHLSKVDVRSLARALGMPTAESEESMGLCFVGERRGPIDRPFATAAARTDRAGRASMSGFAGFLGDYIAPRTGSIVTMAGDVVGQHEGLHTLTIGQGARIGGAKERYFVAAKRAAENEVVVVPGSDHAWLQCHGLRVASFALINSSDGASLASETLLAQIRHRQDAVPCRAHMEGSEVHISFEPPVLSVAEGQFCALYRGQECLGSGVITHVETEGSRRHVSQ